MSATRAFAAGANALLVFSEDERIGKVRIHAQYGIVRRMGERADIAK